MKYAGLIRPIIYPKKSGGRGTEFRDTEEIMRMNDALRQPIQKEEHDATHDTTGQE